MTSRVNKVENIECKVELKPLQNYILTANTTIRIIKTELDNLSSINDIIIDLSKNNECLMNVLKVGTVIQFEGDVQILNRNKRVYVVSLFSFQNYGKKQYFILQGFEFNVKSTDIVFCMTPYKYNVHSLSVLNEHICNVFELSADTNEEFHKKFSDRLTIFNSVDELREFIKNLYTGNTFEMLMGTYISENYITSYDLINFANEMRRYIDNYNDKHVIEDYFIYNCGIYKMSFINGKLIVLFI